MGLQQCGLISSSSYGVAGEVDEQPPPRDVKLNLCNNETDQCKVDLELKIFLNPLILTNLASYLTIEQLRNLRRTCKTWNQIMVSKLVKRSELKTIVVDQTSLNSIHALLSECLVVPFGKFQLINLHFASRKVQGLLNKVGSSLNSLVLTLGEGSELPIDTFRHLILHQCPVLCILHMTDDRVDVARFWNHCLQESSKNEGQDLLPLPLITLPHLKKIILQLNLWELKSGTTLPLINDLFHSAVNLKYINMNHNLSLDNESHVEVYDFNIDVMGRTLLTFRALKSKYGRAFEGNLQTMIEEDKFME